MIEKQRDSYYKSNLRKRKNSNSIITKALLINVLIIISPRKKVAEVGNHLSWKRNFPEL